MAGPAAASTPLMRRYHDPRAYRIVLFDQRGCGRSTPHASLEENTTWHLVDDIERLREHLGIERWQVFGGSWGSTLGARLCRDLSRAGDRARAPGHLHACRRSELEWFYQEGCSWIFPDAFEDYLRVIPEAERGDMIAGLSPASHRSRPGRPARGRARLERMGGQDLVAAARCRARAPLLRGPLRARLRAHRVPLFRQWRLLP